MKTASSLKSLIIATVATLMFTSTAFAETNISSEQFLRDTKENYSYSKFIEYSKAAGYSEQEILDIEKSFLEEDILGLNSSKYSLYNYVPNGCSDPRSWGAYKEIFRPACNSHDYCYSAQYNRGRSREACDNAFYSSMRALCNRLYTPSSNRNISCLNESNVYYWAVRTFGKKHYKGSGDPS
ncbi:MAG: phospholipase A2 [Rothia sp. (in: high G+C Gram-positive bacteria)]|nr:phospholipase A2 [Rothia sp. (in: high G+C Gram-positive bacteria)]